MMTYFEKLLSAKDAVVAVLTEKGVKPSNLMFGGEGAKPEKLPRAPTDARSEFLANRAMGDWAENILKKSIQEVHPTLKVSQFGETSDIAAGDQGFKEHYQRGVEEVRAHGKRPDLLLFPAVNGDCIDTNLSVHPFNKIDKLATAAIGSIEVRSSKFDALTYMRVRAEERLNGSIPSRDSPSFTVKVEDLVIVFRWLERKRIPQAYFQVFFDSVFAINFLDIFNLIGEGGRDIKIESPVKSQQKTTIMIPITRGIQVGIMTTRPEFSAVHKITRLGRHDAYVKPTGGELKLCAEKVHNVIFKH